MKKSRHNNTFSKKENKSKSNKNGKQTENAEKDHPKRDAKDKKHSDYDDEDGFGGWLRSSEGFDMMKLFVIGNSIIILTTVGWPSLQTAFTIISEWMAEQDAES